MWFKEIEFPERYPKYNVSHPSDDSNLWEKTLTTTESPAEAAAIPEM